MRDPNRIDTVLKEIGEIWHKFPDMRLGQLIGNIVEGAALYYMEDNDLVASMKDAYIPEVVEPKEVSKEEILEIIRKHPEELAFVLQSANFDKYIETFDNIDDSEMDEEALTREEFTILKNYFSRGDHEKN